MKVCVYLSSFLLSLSLSTIAEELILAKFCHDVPSLELFLVGVGVTRQ